MRLRVIDEERLAASSFAASVKPAVKTFTHLLVPVPFSIRLSAFEVFPPDG
jgi:hypothetical protein